MATSWVGRVKDILNYGIPMPYGASWYQLTWYQKAGYMAFELSGWLLWKKQVF